ncbi:MAG: DUF2889 domain-containing protein [Actinomycetota bacterium]
MPDEVTPRWTSPSELADGLGADFDRLAAEGPAGELRFSREFRTRLYVMADGWISVTELDDDFHSMRVALRFDQTGVITEAGGRMLRHPYDTCPRALESLRNLVGANVATPGAHNQIKERVPRTEGCLHVADMVTVAFRAFRISKGHDMPAGWKGDEARRTILNLMPNVRDTCVSFAVEP